MKNLKLVVLFLFVAVLFLTTAGFSKTQGPIQQIHLQGQLTIVKTKSLLQPIDVYQYENHLQVNFLSSLGVLNIVVVDDFETIVFQTTKNATANSNITIDTEEWESGEYTLLIMDELGGSLEGSFLID